MSDRLRGMSDDQLPGMLGWRIVKWVIWSVLGLFALLAILLVLIGYIPIPVQFAGLLLFGWIAYLARVLPEITFNREIAIDGALALALALFGLHRILFWWTKQRGSESPKWHFGWTVKITVMALLLFGTSLASIGMIHQTAWLCHEPKLIEIGGMSKETMELSNIRQVDIACRIFADDHGGQLPKCLEDLFPEYLSSHKPLFTIALDDDPPEPILYYAGHNSRDDAGTIIVASPRPWGSPTRHSRIVAYLDGSAGIISESEYQEAIHKQTPASTR